MPTVFDPVEDIIWSADVTPERLRIELEAGLPVNHLKLTDVQALRFMVGKLAKGEVGIDIIDLIQTTFGVKVFIDAKLSGVPHELEDKANFWLEYKPWMLSCMAGGGISNGRMTAEKLKERDGLKRFADVCLAAGTLPCAVTVLTSKTPDVVGREHPRRTSTQQVLTYATWLKAAGFSEIVCSPLEAQAIKMEPSLYGLRVNTPGVRLEDDDITDQARIDTPSGAIKNGADRLVIGTSLTGTNPTNSDLSVNFASIVYEIESNRKGN